MNLQTYVEHEAWHLEEPVEVKIIDDAIILDLTIKRLPRFFETVIIVPSAVLYVLSSVVFVLPAESGEKMSVAVTILLAQVVTFQTLADILPASSQNFPRLVYFVFLITIHLALVCCLGVIGKCELFTEQ